MKIITKPLLAGVAFALTAASSLTASAADIQGSATFELAALPAAVAVANASPVTFGRRYIPATDPADYVIDAAGTGSGQGSITINDAVANEAYSLTLGAATCPTGVTFTPTAAYGGQAVASGANLTYTAGASTLSLGGTLNVGNTATAGQGTCTFQVSLVTVNQ